MLHKLTKDKVRENQLTFRGYIFIPNSTYQISRSLPQYFLDFQIKNKSAPSEVKQANFY